MSRSGIGVSLFSWSMILGGLGFAQESVVVFQNRFDRVAFDAAWHQDASKGNTLRIRNGALEIRAAVNTFAHVERPLRTDLVTATCRLRGGHGISWCISLFLYWGPGDWSQMGVIARGGGCYYVTEMVGGSGSELDLGPCRPDAWHYVRIELGKDCVRYLSSDDGKAWALQHSARRPERLSGPPALLIVGKGYGRGDAAYPRPDLDNDYAPKGAIQTSSVDDVEVRRTPPERLRATAAERARWQARGLDEVGQKELARPGDPTFESVASHFPALRHPREAVGVKEHPFEIGVAADGTLQLNQSIGAKGARRVRLAVGAPPVPLARLRPPRRRLLHGYLPAVVLRFEDRGLTYEQTVFGYSEGLKPQAPLEAFVRMRARGSGTENAETSVRLHLEHGSKTGARAYSLAARAGPAAEVCLAIPYEAATVEAVRQLAPGQFEQKLDEVRRSWVAVLHRGMKIRTAEARVNDAYRAWLAYAFLDVDRRGDRFAPHDGSGFYEQVYGYSAALYCNALDLSGYHAEAERYLESLLQRQRPDGLYVENFGLPDNGALVWSCVQHCRLTGRAEWLRRVAPALTKCCGWAIRERRKTMTPEGQERSVVHGLVRFRPYCDHPKPTVDYFGDAYNCVGIAALAAALDEAGIPDAARLRKEAEAYRKDILASIDAATIERDEMKIIPMEPQTHRLLKSTRYRAGGYYGLVASMFLESGLLGADAPRSTLITDFMERRGGLIAGQCEFARGIDHAYSYGYWLTQLKRDNVRRVLLGFYGMLAYGMTRDTYSGVECTQIRTGRNAHTLPHLYSCTQQIRLLRMMLVREEGDDLLLAWAAPRLWLEDAKRLEVRDAPTCFGPVTFSLRSEANSGRMVCDVLPPTRRSPRSIRLRARHPRGQPIASVIVNGRPWSGFIRDVVELRRLRGPTRIELRFKAQ